MHGYNNVRITSNNCQELRETFGNWLNSYHWTIYYTQTYKWTVNEKQALRQFYRLLDYIRFQYGAKVGYFVAVEYHWLRITGCHIHSLLYIEDTLTKSDMFFRTLDFRQKISESLEKRYGWNRFWEYLPKLGAKYYVSKYVIKEDYHLATWDLGGFFKKKVDF